MCKYLSSAKKLIPAGGESKAGPRQIKGIFGPDTVSYTHLDVYKRQVLKRISWRIF